MERFKAVKGKRSRAVIDHILKHGHITTEDLKETYGYDHPPRAARDVREQGIPLETFKVAGLHGRQIAAYRFADPSTIRGAQHAGRRVFSKDLKEQLMVRDDRQAVRLVSLFFSSLRSLHDSPLFLVRRA